MRRTCTTSQCPCAHLQIGGLVVEFPSDVDVGSPGSHGPASYQAAFHQLVRVMAHDLSVLAGAWLPLISIHHQILGPVGACSQSGSRATRPSSQANSNPPALRSLKMAAPLCPTQGCLLCHRDDRTACVICDQVCPQDKPFSP